MDRPGRAYERRIPEDFEWESWSFWHAHWLKGSAICFGKEGDSIWLQGQPVQVFIN